MDIFCKIINNEIPSYTIYEDEIVKVFLDVNPNHIGHTPVSYTHLDVYKRQVITFNFSLRRFNCFREHFILNSLISSKT